jgi:hypothetical protein
MTHDKMSNWSEGHGHSEDLVHALGGDDFEPPVGVHVVKRGVIPLTDCTGCGRQWKGVFSWAEIAQFYVLPPEQFKGVVPYATPTRSGVLCKLPCNGCGRGFTMLIGWDEVGKWIDMGVRSGCLDARIMQARRQR